MEWFDFVDAYCERTGPGFWAEPVNALTNGAFLLAAVVMAVRLRNCRLPLGWAMVALLAFIGTGSFLFHTHARVWTALADTAPILGFILLYLFASARHYLNLPWRRSLGLVVTFLPVAAALVPVFRLLPVLGVSAGYLPVLVLIAGFALYLRHRAPATARGLAIGAGLLFVSVTLRSLDEPLCAALPGGTHFGWHLLNALMLGWMIEVYRRHMLARRARRR